MTFSRTRLFFHVNENRSTNCCYHPHMYVGLFRWFSRQSIILTVQVIFLNRLTFTGLLIELHWANCCSKLVLSQKCQFFLICRTLFLTFNSWWANYIYINLFLSLTMLNWKTLWTTFHLAICYFWEIERYLKNAWGAGRCGRAVSVSHCQVGGLQFKSGILSLPKHTFREGD